MVITGYLDESGTHKGAILSVMAGFVAEPHVNGGHDTLRVRWSHVRTVFRPQMEFNPNGRVSGITITALRLQATLQSLNEHSVAKASRQGMPRKSPRGARQCRPNMRSSCVRARVEPVAPVGRNRLWWNAVVATLKVLAIGPSAITNDAVEYASKTGLATCSSVPSRGARSLK
jgi:hypothetical protein